MDGWIRGNPQSTYPLPPSRHPSSPIQNYEEMAQLTDCQIHDISLKLAKISCSKMLLPCRSVESKLTVGGGSLIIETWMGENK